LIGLRERNPFEESVMSRRTQRVTVQSGRRGLFNSNRYVEMIGVSLSQPDHYTKLLPAGDIVLPLLMLPFRLLALGVLYATSTPRRMLLAAVVLGVLLLISR
jgi:hypothetical protein